MLSLFFWIFYSVVFGYEVAIFVERFFPFNEVQSPMESIDGFSVIKIKQLSPAISLTKLYLVVQFCIIFKASI